MKHLCPLLMMLWLVLGLSTAFAAPAAAPRVVIGAERLLTKEFLPLIKGKRIGLVTNHTGRAVTDGIADLMPNLRAS